MAIPEHIVSPQAFLEMAKSCVMLDVRSPGEFQQGHLPGAISIPLFSDEERAVVGTAYKHGGRTTSIDEGLKFVGPKLQLLSRQARKLFESQSERKPVLVYCWRGGMRSKSMDWLLRISDIPTVRCDGGYKGCRTYLNHLMTLPRPYMVLGGMTGSAKTEVLHSMTRRKEEVIDLEGLARHFGSAFGNLDRHKQPTTEQFTNELAWRLMEVDDTIQSHGPRPIWVENESRQIGHVYVPEPFHKMLRNAPVLEIERTEQDRLEHLVSMYGEASPKSLVDAFQRIRTKLGGQHAQAAIEHIERGELKEAARIALVYYDKTYCHGMQQHERMRVVNGRGFNPDSIAQACLSTYNEWNPWNLQNISN